MHVLNLIGARGSIEYSNTVPMWFELVMGVLGSNKYRAFGGAIDVKGPFDLDRNKNGITIVILIIVNICSWSHLCILSNLI